MNGPQSFYDDLASDYHLIYPDWEKSIQRQAAALDRILRSRIDCDPPTTSILDCTCGIGTQTLGLTQLGYQLRGTDLSPSAIARARQEAEARDFKIRFDPVDVRELDQVESGLFDVVLSCDNAIPHLMSDAHIESALHQMHHRLKSDGLLLIGIQVILPRFGRHTVKPLLELRIYLG
jgi:glycine/sarcosine N-methyltransferase